MNDNEVHKKIIELYFNDREGFIEDIIFGNKDKKYLNKKDTQQLSVIKALDSGKTSIVVKSGHGNGKTTALAWTFLHYFFTRPECVITCTAPSANQLNDVLWPEIKRWLDFMDVGNNPLGQFLASKAKYTSENVFHIDYPDTWFGAARTASKENPQSLAGRHAKYCLNIIDEASDVRTDVFEIMEANYGQDETIFIAMGNPASLNGPFYKIFQEVNSSYERFTFSCLNSKIASKEYVNKMRERYGEDSDIYKVRVLGEFPQSSSSSFIPYDMARQCIRHINMSEQGPDVIKSMGIDVGFTGDASVIAFREGSCFHRWKEFRNKDPIALAEAAAIEAIKFKPKYIMVDANGMGIGCSRRLKQLLTAQPIEILEVNVASVATQAEIYAKLRDELWGRFKEELRLKTVSIWDNENEDLCGELSAPHFKVDGVIKIESKDHMKADRHLPSGNIADAHLLTCYLPAEEYHLTNVLKDDIMSYDTTLRPLDVDTGY